MQGVDQMFERQVGMSLGLQQCLLGVLQQGVETALRVNLAAQDHGVDEVADQVLRFRAVAIGHGQADAQVVLAAVAVQQHVEGGQQQHERGDAVLPRHGRKRLADGFGQHEVDAAAALAGFGRAGAVVGQFDNGLFAAQPPGPVGQLAFGFAGFQPVALPGREVGMTNRQQRQARFAAGLNRAVAFGEFGQQAVQRPAIGDQMMQGQIQFVAGLALLRRQADQQHPPQRTAFQIERDPG